MDEEEDKCYARPQRTFRIKMFDFYKKSVAQFLFNILSITTIKDAEKCQVNVSLEKLYNVHEFVSCLLNLMGRTLFLVMFTTTENI